MRTASLRPLTIVPRFVQYAVRNCESTLMQLCRCFTVSPLRSACLTVHQTTTKKKVGSCSAHAKQCGCWERRQWELSEILAIRAALKQLVKKMMQCTLFCCDLWKQNISTCCFRFFNTGASPDRTEQSFYAGCFNFAQMKASVQLCINKLSDAAAKSEIKANYEKFDSALGELKCIKGT